MPDSTQIPADVAHEIQDVLCHTFKDVDEVIPLADRRVLHIKSWARNDGPVRVIDLGIQIPLSQVNLQDDESPPEEFSTALPEGEAIETTLTSIISDLQPFAETDVSLWLDAYTPHQATYNILFSVYEDELLPADVNLYEVEYALTETTHIRLSDDEIEDSGGAFWEQMDKYPDAGTLEGAVYEQLEQDMRGLTPQEDSHTGKELEIRAIETCDHSDA